MFYVYILTNAEEDKYYIGYSSDLKRRLNEHKAGKVYWSRRLENVKLYYYEAYHSEELAKQRERKLKQYGSALKGLVKRIGLQ